MGAGRKTQTVLADTAAEPRSVAQRGLKRENLGGVIFVCNNETMEECLSKSLFGLPRPHLNYVLNVEEGMPLFLFNYDMRELMGIFVATGPGGYNIDPYAWSPGGKTQSRYPAQVRVKLDRECKAVPEKVFSRVIRENYYAPGKLMFELTKKQVHELLGLFVPVAKEPVAAARANAVPKPAAAKVPATATGATAVPKPAEPSMPKPKPPSPLPNAWKKVEKPAPPANTAAAPPPPPPANWKEAVSGKAPAATPAEKPPPVAEEKKSWFEQTEEEEQEQQNDYFNEEQQNEYFNEEQEEVEVLEQILEKLQVGESSKPEQQQQQHHHHQHLHHQQDPEKFLWSSSNQNPEASAGEKMMKAEQAALESERENLVRGMQDSSIALIVEKNLRLCSDAVMEMRESENALNQILDELRMKGECLKELEVARVKNVSLIKVSMSMAQDITRLKSEVQQLKQQIIAVQ